MQEGRAYLRTLTNILLKYRYVLLVAGVGLLLLLWPSGRQESQPAPQESREETADVGEMEARLTAILARAAGVGRVEVMLSLESDMEYLYLDETSRSYEERAAGEGGTLTSGEERVEYMTVRGQDGGETPVLRKRLYPAYQGAVVICDGAEDAGTRLKIIRAVGALTGLSSERISVLKMK